MRPGVFTIILERKKARLSILTWLKLLVLEGYLGEQLLEMLANTASYPTSVKAQLVTGSVASGWKAPLVDFIPATLINRAIVPAILNLLQKKFVETYELVREASFEAQIIHIGKSKKPLFELNPNKLHLLTELKLAYNTVWITINLTIDAVVFIVSRDLVYVLAAGGLVEVIRRFKI